MARKGEREGTSHLVFHLRGGKDTRARDNWDPFSSPGKRGKNFSTPAKFFAQWQIPLSQEKG